MFQAAGDQTSLRNSRNAFAFCAWAQAKAVAGISIIQPIHKSSVCSLS